MNHALKEGGEPSTRIDEVPLEWCFQPAVKLDFRRFEDGYVVTPGDVETELKRIGHQVRPLEIVVINTRAGTRYGEDDYVDAGCGMGKAATMWLLERGVRLVGTDGWSWDAPFSHTRRKLEQGGGAELIWEGHRAGREIGYSHLEKLHNLELLPSHGFQIVCFPVKIHRASAGWTRAVAIVDDSQNTWSGSVRPHACGMDMNNPTLGVHPGSGCNIGPARVFGFRAAKALTAVR